MRILQIIQKKQYRGAEIFCCQLSNHLMNLGHEVEVYSVYDGKASLPLERKKVKTLNRNQKRRFVDYSGWKQLAGIIKNFKPDIVQANAADTLKYAVMSRFVFGWKAPLVYRNASASSFYVKSFFSRTINRFLLRNVDIIISVSKASKSDINKLFPFTVSKSKVIPVGIEEKALDKIPDSTKVNQQKKNIIHIGSFTKEKNHFGLVDIFRKVKAILPEVELHLLGEGPLKNDVLEKVKIYGLENSVKFYGEIQDPLPYLKASDLLVLPSIIEGLPAVILEAMYAKVPVVAFKVGGISEIITPETGNILKCNDNQGFADTIVQQLKKSHDLKVDNAYNMVKHNYLNKEIAKKFLETYQSVQAN